MILKNYFEKMDQGYMIEPCGIGKSFLSIYFASITSDIYILQIQMKDDIFNYYL